MNINEPEILSQNIGDTTIEYLLYRGKGPTIFLMHATGMLPWLWHPIARELSKSYRVIVPNFFNHRDGDPENDGIGWLILAKDFCSLCKKLNVESPVLVGHSMGGAVITLAAATCGLKAEKMLLFEPIYPPREFYKIRISLKDHPMAGKAIKRHNSWKDSAEAKTYLKSKHLFSTWDDEILDLYIEHGMEKGETGNLKLVCSPKKEAALFMGSRQFDPWPVLSNVNCPVMVIEGESSDQSQYIEFKKAASLFINAEYLLLKNTGHLIPMEKPKEVVQIIKQFIEKSV